MGEEEKARSLLRNSNYVNIMRALNFLTVNLYIHIYIYGK